MGCEVSKNGFKKALFCLIFTHEACSGGALGEMSKMDFLKIPRFCSFLLILAWQGWF
jgi:hypothetical protein